MNSTLTKEAYRELTEILQKQFNDISVGFPSELVEDLGLTLLNLTVVTLKRRLKINKREDTL